MHHPAKHTTTIRKKNNIYVLFGLMHFIPSIGAISLNELCLQAIQYVLAGIAFCLVYIKRGNVVFGIAAHMSINLMHNLMYLVNKWGLKSV